MIKNLKKLIIKNITNFKRKFKNPKTRDMATPRTRDIEKAKKPASLADRPITDSFKCPYCLSFDFVKRGFRKKKHEKVQLYLCRACKKVFTAHISKGKHYPLPAVLDGLSYYHLGYSLEKVCRLLKQRHGLEITPPSIANWLTEFGDYCPFARMRGFALKKYAPQGMVIQATLAHRQLFRYRFHQAKCQLIIEDDYKHRNFGALKEFLEMVPGECPHQYFSEGLRASEIPMVFSKTQMIVRAKQNFATKTCKFVLQSVRERKNRHQALQKFMLCNDSVTVATEVPVYLTRDDLLHMQTQLGFEIYNKISRQEIPNSKNQISNKSQNSNIKIPKLITGHIDLLQIRNGQIHILDYKSQAEKEKPIEQLTLYAMALSRLTGLRMFDFKCAWFDENDYFEFYPLHVVHKPQKGRRRRKITTPEGVYLINQIKEKIERIRPLPAKS